MRIGPHPCSRINCGQPAKQPYRVWHAPALPGHPPNLLALDVLSTQPIDPPLEAAGRCKPWIFLQRSFSVLLLQPRGFHGRQLRAAAERAHQLGFCGVHLLSFRPPAMAPAAGRTSAAACLFPGNRSRGARASALHDSRQTRFSVRADQTHKGKLAERNAITLHNPAGIVFAANDKLAVWRLQRKPPLRLAAPGGQSANC